MGNHYNQHYTDDPDIEDITGRYISRYPRSTQEAEYWEAEEDLRAAWVESQLGEEN